jgi:membrane-associated protein
MTAALFSRLTEWLADVSGNPWFYGLIFAIAFLDAILPIVPSETAVILGGIAAGRGSLWLPIVIVVAALGASLGDNTAYEIGKRAAKPIERWSSAKPKRAQKLLWAKTQLEKRGGSLLLTARFIPGGRTMITLASGITEQPRKRFVTFVGIAAVIWAAYAAILGYVFGERFKDDHTKALLLAFGCAISVTILIEIIRHFRNRNAHE